MAVHATVRFGVAAGPSFPAAVSGDSRYLVDQNDDPWFGVGDTNWSFAVQATTAQITGYLEDRAAKGVNLVIVNLLEHFFSSQTPKYRNVNGDDPFTGIAFQSTTDDTYMDHAEWIQSEAERLGITILWCPQYLGFSGSDEGWNDEIDAAYTADPTNFDDYGNELVARFGAYPNAMWLMGHDRTPSTNQKDASARISDAIQAGSGHLVTVGAQRNVDQAAAWASSGVDWDFYCAYFDEEEPANDSSTVWAKSPTLPFGWLEGRYKDDSAAPTPAELRSQMYGPFCAGACFVIGGTWDIAIGGYDSGGWTSAEAVYDDSYSLDLERFATLIGDLGTNWAGMTPDTTDTFLTVGEGTGAARVAARFNATATTGTIAVAYRPHTGASSLTFDLTELDQVANVRVRKFDPTNGTYTTIDTYATSGSQSVGSLGTNSAGDSDWLLTFEVP